MTSARAIQFWAGSRHQLGPPPLRQNQPQLQTSKGKKFTDAPNSGENFGYCAAFLDLA
jgi:hypothetical protein